MGQGSDAALGSSIAFALRLAHPIPGGRNINNAGTFSEIRCKEFAQVKGGGYTDGKSMLKLLVGACVNSDETGRRVIHQHIHPAVFADDGGCKCFQRFLISDVTDIVGSLGAVDHANLSTLLMKFLSDALADAGSSAGNHNNFILKHGETSFLRSL